MTPTVINSFFSFKKRLNGLFTTNWCHSTSLPNIIRFPVSWWLISSGGSSCHTLPEFSLTLWLEASLATQWPPSLLTLASLESRNLHVVAKVSEFFQLIRVVLSNWERQQSMVVDCFSQDSGDSHGASWQLWWWSSLETDDSFGWFWQLKDKIKTVSPLPPWPQQRFKDPPSQDVAVAGRRGREMRMTLSLFTSKTFARGWSHFLWCQCYQRWGQCCPLWASIPSPLSLSWSW